MRVIHMAAPMAAGLLLLSACGDSSSSSSSSSSSTGGGATGSASTSAASSSTSSVASFSCATGTLTLSGSTALQPLAQKAATDYQTKCPGSTITVSGGGSSTGLSNVDAGTSDIGMSDVPSSNAKTLKNQLTDHQVAIVLFAVVVNPKTGVTKLTSQQVQDVFSGKVTNWKDVGGSDVPVTLILRKSGSGTRLTFDKTVMKGVSESDHPAQEQDSTQLVVQGVQAADGGASYVNVASAGTLTAVQLDGASPTEADLSAGKYPFFSHEHMYTVGAGSPIAQSFISFIVQPDYGTAVKGLGFVVATVTKQQSAVDAG